MIDPDVLYDKLASMVYPSEIRDFCASQQIVGVASEDTSCVLARLFQRDTSVRFVRVCGEHIEWAENADAVYSDWWETSGWGEQRALTEAMKGFIHNFDSGQYPDLEVPIEEYD